MSKKPYHTKQTLKVIGRLSKPRKSKGKNPMEGKSKRDRLSKKRKLSKEDTNSA